MKWAEFQKKAQEKNKNLILNYSGVCGEALKVIIPGIAPERKLSSVFFQPYASKSDFAYRAASIISGPACFLLLAAEIALVSVYLVCRALFELVRARPKEAGSCLVKSLLMIGLVVPVTLGVAAASPFISAADLVVGGVRTAVEKCCCKKDKDTETWETPEEALLSPTNPTSPQVP